MIQSAAIRTNKLLTKVIQDLPYPVDKSSRQSTAEKTAASRTFTGSPTPSRQPTLQAGPQRDASSPESITDGQPSTASDKTTAPQTQKSRSGTAVSAASETPSRPQSRTSSISTGPPAPAVVAPMLPPPVQEEQDEDEDEDEDVFDYVATVNGLTVQFLSEHEQTRVAALQWLIMLHQKAPKKVRDY